MRVDKDLWTKKKDAMRKRLLEDLHIGYLDEDISDILLKIFEREDAFSISSCSGRIIFVDAQLPWIRKSSTVIFKKHKPITVEEYIESLNKPLLNALWIIVTGPIIHISTATLKEAFKLISAGRAAGFKHSGIISFRRDGIVLELKSGIGLTYMAKKDNNVLIDLNNIGEVVNACNDVLLKGKERLNRLKEVLSKLEN
ncbi:MAG: hypothetical protein RMH77_03820 [Sulfolobales archaeon]|nr:hypothetical protein [Sulfolobales archaeon]MCX8185575.1 hypothetical protein [Sulfolobales archaeon]MDW7969518.1 hypothetical protein [Sulfolobales archaeon]